MGLDLSEILLVTVSGIREEEKASVISLIGDCGLHTEDLADDLLRNFLVARKGQTVLGTVGLEIAGSFGLLRSLAIAQSHRGQGIGSRLVHAMERYAASLGIRRLYLLTMTAALFFERHQFERTDRASAPAGLQLTSEFKSLCPDSAVCMQKTVKVPTA